MNKFFTVSQINNYVAELLENHIITASCSIKGEISGFKFYQQSGHIYFSLKDETSTISCVMFRQNNRNLKFKPTDGMEVIAFGRVSIFAQQGKYQLYVQGLDIFGQGALLQYLDELKQRLSEKGYFDQDRKKPIPRIVNKVGVATSTEGAALQDILRILKQRHPQVEVVVAHCAVQGIEAPDEIVAAIRLLCEHNQVEVIIVGRGGGSYEDLMAFNHEQVVKSIFDAHIPVISAVGHEVDFTLSDLAADIRASTPSQAAHLAVAEMNQVDDSLRKLNAHVFRSFERILANNVLQLDRLMASSVWQNPALLVKFQEDKLLERYSSLEKSWQSAMQEKRNAIQLLMSKLDSLSPLKVLMRGFALIEKNEIVVNDSSKIAVGDQLTIKMADADLRVNVNGKELVERWPSLKKS